MNLSASKSKLAELGVIVRRQKSEVRLHRRARMVLLAVAGEPIAAIARTFRTTRVRVRHWLRSFGDHRVAGLADEVRTGRPVDMSPLERHQVIAVACRPPHDFGIERTLWSHEALRSALISAKLVRRISASTIGRILDEAEIKPHRVKMWCHSKDPAFQEKMRAIVDLYTDPPRGEPVLCIDEKTGMQALSRSRDLRPSEPGKSGRFDFEYRRNGTRCLFACFNTATGKLLGRVTKQRKRPDFFAFMDLVASVYRQRRVHVILDNLNTHRDTTKGDFVSQWNRRHGNRFTFHYTPTHGSWLYQVELWFGIVSRRILRYGNFPNPDVLVAAIEAFVAQWNDKEAHPFRWTYDGLPLVSGVTA
jgi:transposase